MKKYLWVKEVLFCHQGHFLDMKKVLCTAKKELCFRSTKNHKTNARKSQHIAVGSTLLVSIPGYWEERKNSIQKVLLLGNKSVPLSFICSIMPRYRNFLDFFVYTTWMVQVLRMIEELSQVLAASIVAKAQYNKSVFRFMIIRKVSRA